MLMSSAGQRLLHLVYFDGHTTRPITCNDRLGSYHYVKEGRGEALDPFQNECSGTGQAHTVSGSRDRETEEDWRANVSPMKDVKE